VLSQRPKQVGRVTSGGHSESWYRVIIWVDGISNAVHVVVGYGGVETQSLDIHD
jgi:hypothetical protein